ncbi:hypothetical protein K3495_g3182 [Podosphaera aphanis]|nr:hypothetical protein K3495_g3182 [Podosphaera aphanis]
MSYASVAAKGPVQSLDEKCAPAPLEIERSEAITANTLVDVDSDSVHTVPADFGSQPLQTQTQADRIELEFELEDSWAKADYEKAKTMAAVADQEKRAGQPTNRDSTTARCEADANSPFHRGNGIALAMLSMGLGIGAYRRFGSGELTWRVVGIWTGVVGGLCIVDLCFLRWILPFRRS